MFRVLDGIATQANARRARCCQTIVLSAILFPATAATAEKAEPSLYARPCCCEVERAGYPWRHFPWATCQVESDYTGYYVGGGSPVRGCSRGRCADEGTWGWDYTGRWFRRLVRLGWTHPPREQGGAGAYAPDGPRFVEAIKHRLEHEE